MDKPSKNFRQIDPTREPAFCAAPPITAKLLSRYDQLAAEAPGFVGASMQTLCRMVRTFHETPESELPARVIPCHAVQGGEVKTRAECKPLTQAEADRIFDVIPWPAEVNAMAGAFELIDNETQRELRDAAFHLVWYARELGNDREPITQDKLK